MEKKDGYDNMKINGNTNEIIITLQEAKAFAEKGHISDKLITFFESQIGHKLPEDTLIRVETGKANLHERLTTEALFFHAIEETDAIIQSNDVYRKLYYGNNLEESYKRWCKPELFFYLELRQNQALEEIRAAAYPSAVSFHDSVRSSKNSNEVYRTPYLSFQDTVDSKGLSLPKERNIMLSFYLNNNKEVKYTMSEIMETYTDKDLKKKPWNEFSFQREQKIAKKNSMPILSETYLNIKTGEKVYSLTKQLMGESALASAKNRINNTAWFKTWSGRENNLANLSDSEKVTIVQNGRACIEILHQSLLDTSGLHRTPDGSLSKSFDHEI